MAWIARRWSYTVTICAVVTFGVRSHADEVCQRNPNPVCIVDWAASMPGATATRVYRSDAVRIRLRLDLLEDAHRLAAATPGGENFDPLVLAELQARSGRKLEPNSTFESVRDAFEAWLDEIEARNRPLRGYINPALALMRYQEVADAQRRSGRVADARETARRAIARAWSFHRRDPKAMSNRDVARSLAIFGVVYQRAGDREAARAALAAAEALIPAGIEAAEYLDAYREIARLRAVLDDTAPLRESMSALVREIEVWAKDAPSEQVRLSLDVLADIAEVLREANDREGARQILNASSTFERKAAEGGYPAAPSGGKLRLLIANDDWQGASAALLPRLRSLGPLGDQSLEHLAIAQAQRGALKEAVETALRASRSWSQANILRLAALAATAEK